mgnify:FL=1
MSLRARATAFCVWSFHSILMRKVPHKSVVIRRKVPHKSVVIRRKVPHKNVKYLFLSLIISIFASCKTNDNLLWKDL